MGNAYEGSAGSAAARRLTPITLRRSAFGVVGSASLVLICAALLAPSQALGQAPNSGPRTTAARISHVSKTLSVPTRSGTFENLVVEIDDWSFPKGDTEIDMPGGSGATIMTVGNGSISAVIAGVAKTFNTGDYWSVPAGTQMKISIKAPHQGAILRTIVAVPAS